MQQWFKNVVYKIACTRYLAAIFIVFSVGFLICDFSAYALPFGIPDIETEREYWKSVENYSKKHPKDNKLYCKYLKKYPAGEFKDIALAECPTPDEVPAPKPVVNPEPQKAAAVAPVEETNVLKVGDNYQGGIIFYIDDTGKHGLVAAPTDQTTNSKRIHWCNGCSLNLNTLKVIGAIPTGATGTAIGTGQANTLAIVKAQGDGNYAAKLCDDLVLNGYDDWFLPSKYELNLMYNAIGQGASGALKNGGGFVPNFYWSSSEYNADYAWYQEFYYGDQAYDGKTGTLYVRAVRAF